MLNIQSVNLEFMRQRISQLITDQITDQYAPYCSELRYAVTNDYRVLTDCWWMR